MKEELERCGEIGEKTSWVRRQAGVVPDTAELGKVWALMDLVCCTGGGTEYFGG